MILFLDFDGVLHPEPCYQEAQLFCYLPRLENVLRDFQEVQIVISSTWRDKRSLTDLKAFFSEDIADRIIGTTPNWREVSEIMDTIGYQRHAEIEGWLRLSGRPWLSWLAIDDKPYLFKPFLKNLIKTNSLTGFNDQAEEHLRLHLAVASRPC